MFVVFSCFNDKTIEKERKQTHANYERISAEHRLQTLIMMNT